jgi:hypothetical protein
MKKPDPKGVRRWSDLEPQDDKPLKKNVVKKDEPVPKQ